MKKIRQYHHNFRLLFNSLYIKAISGIVYSQVREYGHLLGTRPLNGTNNNRVKYVGATVLPSGDTCTLRKLHAIQTFSSIFYVIIKMYNITCAKTLIFEKSSTDKTF